MRPPIGSNTASTPAARLVEILGSIIDGYAAERSHQIVLGLGRGAEHLQPHERAELQRGRSYSTGGAVNQHALALAQLRDAMDQLIRGGVIQNQTDRFGGIESGGNSHEFGLRQHDIARVSAGLRNRGDHIAALPLRNAGAAGINDADDIVAGRIG